MPTDRPPVINSAPVFYRSGEGDPTALSGLRIAVLGYGHLGSSVAGLLRQAGLDVVVGNRSDERRQLAEADGFSVSGIAEATAASDLIWVLLPDEVIPGCFDEEIVPSLRAGSTVCFASGYCLAFGLVDAPAGIDVIMLAPRMLGEELAAVIRRGGSYVSYVSVEQNATGQAQARLLGLAEAVGALRRGAMSLPAAQEALLDLFVEQTVGPYLGTAIQLAFSLGVEAGLPPEALVLEMYGSGEMSQVFRSFATEGFYRSVNGHGVAATYGGFLRTMELDMAAMRRHFGSVLESIRSGAFAVRLQDEQAKGYPTLSAIQAVTSADDGISSAEATVLAMLGAP